MQRLLMGEVGSGKTGWRWPRCCGPPRVAAQAAFMAPTETLAEQHMRDARPACSAAHVPIGLLDRLDAGRRRRELLDRLASGELGMIVGTHALIEPAVEFRGSALAVVDEQHRFGVRQRAALDAKARRTWSRTCCT